MSARRYQPVKDLVQWEMGALKEPIWELQEQLGEIPSHFHAFCHFRDLVYKRSITKAYEKHALECLDRDADTMPENRRAIPCMHWRTWAKQERWVERANAWDKYLDKISTVAQEEERRKMAIRHAEIAAKMVELGNKKLKALNDMPEILTPTQTVEMIVNGAKLERLSRGEPTENIQQQVNAVHEHHFSITGPIVNVPGAISLACRLIELIAGANPGVPSPGEDISTDDSGGPSLVRESEEVDPGATSGDPE